MLRTHRVVVLLGAQGAAAGIAREAVGLSSGCSFALVTGESQTQSGLRRGTVFAKVLPSDDPDSE